MEKMNGQTVDLEKTNIEKLKELFPEIVADGKVDFAMLKNLLGGEIDESNEKYSFTWNGKSATIKNTLKPTTGTLIPCKEKSVDWDTTENLYIEGDNLEVLKILQKTYSKKIKMIYIDPPYNTGKDFVYKDNFVDSIANYKEITGQQQRANPDTNGRFHTDWLNMMYARLMLAKNLLSDDGVIFISIDENECANLKKICDEVFGEGNFFGDLIWEATTQPINAGIAKFGLQEKTETILLYGKHKNTISGFTLEELNGELNYPHRGKFGACRFEIIEKSDAGGYNRPTMRFPILGQYPREGKRWQIGEETARLLEAQGKVEIVDGIVKRAVYPEDEIDKKQYKPFWSLFTAEEVCTAQNGKDELNKLMECALGFDTVKPVKLIKKLLSYLGDNYIAVDFFSGSATTAHAVMQLNAEDGGNRKYIMVQIPEKCDDDSEAYKAGYKTICEIGEERIRRAGAKIKSENPTAKDLDTGFKVFKLESTNIVPWDSSAKLTEEDLLSLSKTIKDDRKEEDVVYEIMLKYGVFDKKMDKVTLSNKTVYNINDGFMIICLDNNITMNDVEDVAKLKPNCVVFKEAGFKDDNEKLNATYTLERCKVEKILCI